MKIGSKQQSIVHGVDGSAGSRWVCDPAREVVLVPVRFVSKREDMCCFKACPEAKVGIDRSFPRYDASTIA